MITLNKAKLVRNLQLPGQALKNRLTFVTLLTQKTAVELGAAWLVFEKGGGVRGGFTSVALEASFADATVTHDCGKLGMLKLKSTAVTHFAVHRLGDGKKKPKRVMLSCQVEYIGNSGGDFDLQDHMLKCGKADGELSIEAPEQQELPGVGAEPDVSLPALETVLADRLKKPPKLKPPSIRRVKK